MSQNKYPHVSVSVKSMYMNGASNPSSQQYTFSYTVTIENHGPGGAQLLNRYWSIKNSHDQAYEVQGQGVIGEQPHLPAGETYQYSSATVIDTPVGTMEGYYEMQTDQGEVFNVPIDPFLLAVPGHLN